MKIVALEEHFVTKKVLEAWSGGSSARDDLAERGFEAGLLDLGAGRLAAMDDMGVDVQVLSITTPGLQSLGRDQATALQTEVNDLLATTVKAHPDRFEAFATLATPDPKAAVRELERAIQKLGFQGAMVYGRTGSQNMDHKDYWPIYEAAAASRAPLYLHPQPPPPEVQKAYYSGFGETVDALFGRPGIGWHYDAGIQLLRMVLSGVFDQYPDLHVITGHWGEVILFYLERINLLTKPAGLKNPISHYIGKNVSITPSGVFSERYLRWSLEVLGADHILYSVDHPFASAKGGKARRFLDEAKITQEEREKIAFRNWDRICSNIKR